MPDPEAAPAPARPAPLARIAPTQVPARRGPGGVKLGVGALLGGLGGVGTAARVFDARSVTGLLLGAVVGVIAGIGAVLVERSASGGAA